MILEKAKAYALKYLTYRPRSIKEVKDYLKKKKVSPEIIEKVIDYLLTLSYLNDEEFCALWIRNRMQLKPMGKKRLYNELVEKGVEASLIEEVLQKMMPEEVEIRLARQLLIKKKLRINEPEKLKSFLYRRGFSFSIIEKVFK